METLKEYLQRRTVLTTSPALFISYVKPHKPVHKETISRWLKHVLLLAGIDTNIFSAHSYRAASTSSTKTNIPIADILKQGQWSTEKTWCKYYNLDVIHSPPYSTAFADAILEH